LEYKTTTEELRRKFNNEFRLSKWPATYEVDSETYANVCQTIFEWAGDLGLVKIAIGPNNGIMFKNVELILKKND
jgi:hypothetical protein